MKIIGFDGWTQGSRFYEQLVEQFTERGLDLVLIHLGSWGNEKGRPESEKIGNLSVRDISYYRDQAFPAILDQEQPSAVIFLSLDAFAHRAFNRYCQARGIPTIHLNHGIRTVFDVESRRPFQYNFFSRLYNLRNHISKQIFHFLPVYVQSLWKTSAPLTDWTRLLEDVFSRVIGVTPHGRSKDARASVNCVYVEADATYSITKYKYLREQVVVVGNADLLTFGLRREQLGSALHRVTDSPDVTDSRDVMYVDTANIDYGLVFTSATEFVQHLLDTRVQLALLGKRVLFKPHPRSYRKDIIGPLKAAGLEIVSKETFIDRLTSCCACITEPSSAALVPALMGMPLFLAKYARYKGQEFGELLNSYPRAIALNDLGQFDILLSAERRNHNHRRTMEWIRANAGPLPAEDLPSRVANAVLELTA